MDELARLVDERMAASGRRPFLIGIGGGVAVGKTTTATALQGLLADGPGHPDVALVATDGFLLPNAVLDERGIGHRKGYPESYDVATLTRFLDTVRRGERAAAPVYDHLTYDIVVGEEQVLDRPDIVIVEGLNALQVGADRFDLTIYVDADEADIETWFVTRLLALWEAGRDDETSFFHALAGLTDDEARSMAHAVWAAVNGPNLREHILPTRDHADVILEKAADHRIVRIHHRDAP